MEDALAAVEAGADAIGFVFYAKSPRAVTVQQARAMIDADVSRAKRAEKVDALAAAHILQGAIDALANLSAPQ